MRILRGLTLAFWFLAPVVVAETNPITQEEVIIDNFPDIAYNISVARYTYPPNYWYVYYQAENDKIFAVRGEIPNDPSGPYYHTDAVKLTPDGHSFGGNVCVGTQNNVWGLGGLVFTDESPLNEVLLTLNHACQQDPNQERFFYIWASGTTRTSGGTARKFFDVSNKSYVIWDPVPFQVTEGFSQSTGGKFGFFFVWTETTGTRRIGYGVHRFTSSGPSYTRIMAWDGNGLQSRDWTWVTLDASTGWKLPASYQLGYIDGLNLLPNFAEYTQLGIQIPLQGDPSKVYIGGKGQVLMSTIGPFQGTCGVDLFYLREFYFSTGSGHFLGMGDLVYTYTDIDYLGPCEDARLCHKFPTRTPTVTGGYWTDHIFWGEYGSTAECYYSFRLMHGKAAYK